jgi:hypothetical protein
MKQHRMGKIYCLSKLQRAAVWIGLAFSLQTLIQVDQLLMASDSTRPALFQVIFNAFLPLALILCSFFAICMAIRPSKHFRQAGRTTWLWRIMILIAVFFMSLAGIVEFRDAIAMSYSAPQLVNDGASLDTNAANQLLQGKNPYTDPSIMNVTRQYALQPNWTNWITPLHKGQFVNSLDYPSHGQLRKAFLRAQKTGNAQEFEFRVSYPALAFLSLVPFVFVKYYNPLPFYLLCYLIIIAVACMASHRELRLWVLVFGLANIPMWSLVNGLNVDILYSLLMLLAWLLRDHRWRSALFLGLAIATKQLAWFFAPFYFILIWRSIGFKETIFRMIIAASLGLAINLPFIVWNVHAWFAGILAPVADPMFPLGVGFISLSTAHILPYFPSWVYALLEGCAMLGSLYWYWRHCLRHPEIAMLLAVFPLIFAWRSLLSYFNCITYPIFVLMVAKTRHTDLTPLGLTPTRDVRPNGVRSVAQRCQAMPKPCSTISTAATTMTTRKM